MKIANRLAIVSSVVLAAGCAHHDQNYSRYQYNEGNPSYSSTTTMTTPSGAATEQSTAPSTGFGTSAQSSTTTPDQSTTGQTSTGLTTTPAQGISGDADRSLTTQAQQSLFNDPSLTGASSSLFETNNQSGTPGSLVPPTPTSDSGSLNRIYSTNQTGTGFSGTETNSLGFSGRIQGVTETDKTLGRQIMQQLRSDASLITSLPMIRVSIDNGKVTLTGTVNSQQDKKSIETAVQGISGVATVDNQLQVKGATGTESGTNPNPTPTPNSNPNP